MNLFKKVILIILDGFGLREETKFNAIKNATTPNWDKYTKEYAFGAIDASSIKVGLPANQFGNSEVGHLNMGAGRIVQQDITRINLAIENNSFFENQILNNVSYSTNGTIHIMGLLSDGGVHAHFNHIIALLKFFNSKNWVNIIWLHIFLDGRDTPPQSAIYYINQLLKEINNYPKAHIATLSGRYYAMDRDNRYDRIKLAYEAIAYAKNLDKRDPISIINDSYTKNINDEFLIPCALNNYQGIEDNDSIIFANFRSDRAIQLSLAFTDENFAYFPVKKVKISNFITMTNYDKNLKAQVIFNNSNIINTLGEYIAKLGLKQLRIAETEKYPHITYFFNGGKKEINLNEDRILIDSPREVATYDLKPEMSLPLVTEKLVESIRLNKYDIIITNFANGDMVGHSGNIKATIKAVEAIDLAIGKVITTAIDNQYEVIITADHGNCEEMFDIKYNQPHTQHTTNLVPFLYIGRKAKIKANGSLKDVAPSILAASGLDKPTEMTGENLIIFDYEN